jgi:dTDP-4-dehydrorhamnose 3,5-epimerase
MIDGVNIVKLAVTAEAGGKTMDLMKSTDSHFTKFGEIYFSCAYPGAIKAWHIHQSMTLNNVVVTGRARLMMYDSRPESPTNGEVQEVLLGDDNYCLVQIPPGIVNGYQVYGDKMVILANCASEPHDPEEIIRIDPFSPDVPYTWDLNNG